MEYLNSNYYVEVKDKRYFIHPTENILSRLREEPKFLRTQYQVQSDMQIRKNQKVIRVKNDEIVVKIYPQSKHPIIQQQLKFKLPGYPSFKRNVWLEPNKRW